VKSHAVNTASQIAIRFTPRITECFQDLQLQARRFRSVELLRDASSSLPDHVEVLRQPIQNVSETVGVSEKPGMKRPRRGSVSENVAGEFGLPHRGIQWVTSRFAATAGVRARAATVN
jgi:hypothetical protein